MGLSPQLMKSRTIYRALTSIFAGLVRMSPAPKNVRTIIADKRRELSMSKRVHRHMKQYIRRAARDEIELSHSSGSSEEDTQNDEGEQGEEHPHHRIEREVVRRMTMRSTVTLQRSTLGSL